MQITVGISGTGGGFEKFCAGETDISDASRPIKDDEEAPVCEKGGVKYTEVAGRQRRHRRRDEQGARRRLPDRRPAQAGLEQGLEGQVARRGRPEAARHRAVALRPGHRLRHVRLLHRRDQRRGGREPRGLRGLRGRQPARHGRLRRRRAASATSASPTTRAPRTSSTWSASTAATATASSRRPRRSRTAPTSRSPARCSCTRARRRSSAPRSRRSWTSSIAQAPADRRGGQDRAADRRAGHHGEGRARQGRERRVSDPVADYSTAAAEGAMGRRTSLVRRPSAPFALRGRDQGVLFGAAVVSVADDARDRLLAAAARRSRSSATSRSATTCSGRSGRRSSPATSSPSACSRWSGARST